ncbi:MAG: hypothetical protein P1U36_00785 [Legionellaceae bacterium]|nr:hypothetical protein [Legionellaceae bacterium]
MNTTESKIANPLNHYKLPNDVSHDRTLSLDEKIKILDNWQNDIELRQHAEEENMASLHELRDEVDTLRRLLRTYRTHQEHTRH